MKQTSNRIDAAELGHAEASWGGELPVELKPGVMGTFVVRMLNGQSPLGRRQAARSFNEPIEGAVPVDGFGEDEEEEFDEEEEEDFEEEDEFADEEDDDFDDEEEDDEDEESDDEDEEEDFDDEEDAEEDLDEDEQEEQFDDEV